MAFEEALTKISREAASDLSSAQYHMVAVDSNGQVALTGTGAAADGVLQDKPDAAGKAGSVGIAGVTKVEAAEAITAGDDIASNSAGEAVTATTGDIVNGVALEDASGDGVLFSMLIKHTNEPLA